MKFEVIRIEENKFQTISKFIIHDDWNCEIAQGFILEPEDDDNKVGIARINEGEYECVKRNSPKYGDHFHILNVEDRSYILIHIGNYRRDTRGCLLPGQSVIDIDGDGLKDVTSSGPTMRMLNRLLPDKFTVVIKNQINGEV